MKMILFISTILATTISMATPVDLDSTGVWCRAKQDGGGKLELIKSAGHTFTLKYTAEDGSYSYENTSTSKKTELWDGHASGMITGEGFSLVYFNDYGCIGGVDVVLYQKGKNVQRASFLRCEGMSADYCQGPIR